MAQKIYMSVHEMRNSYLHYFSICMAASVKTMNFTEYCDEFTQASGLPIRDTRLPREEASNNEG